MPPTEFDLVWSEEGGSDRDFDRFFAAQANGLVGTADRSGMYVNFARRSGGSPVHLTTTSKGFGRSDASMDVSPLSKSRTGTAARVAISLLFSACHAKSSPTVPLVVPHTASQEHHLSCDLTAILR
jgi:hypothetical protein